MKRDKYLRARGGSAVIYSICCAACDSEILQYQKDGIGFLHRCYLNRIISPLKYSNLQYEQAIIVSSDMPNLSCDCGETIGHPMKHKDGRLAFRLELGKFKKQKLSK